ncbi:hypothetical protein CGCFRS4_v014341 [Colletotrichum fructicola]|nr:hypothetical protein CGCFRS4_v014341 [Colletotrichum fructicola]
MGGFGSVPLYPANSCYCGWCMPFMSEEWTSIVDGTSSAYVGITADPQAEFTDAHLSGALGGAHLAFATPTEEPHHWTCGSVPQPTQNQNLFPADGDEWRPADETIEPITVFPSSYSGQMTPLEY